MSIVYVTTAGASVRRRGDLAQVWHGKKKLADLKLGGLDRLVLVGPVQITSQAAGLLMSRGVDVAFLTGGGRYRGALVAATSRNVFLRLAQFDRWRDEPFRVAVAREVVRAKIVAQRKLVLRWRRDRPVRIEGDPVAALSRQLDQLETATDLDALRGHEGAASLEYWRQFSRMLPESIPFPGRKMHPSTDPANALLSLGYVLLTNELGGYLEGVGLDPFVGMYHGLRYGRKSLPLDVIEPFRQPVIDRLTLRLLNRGQIRADDFEGGQGGLRLEPEKLRQYLTWHDEALRAESEGAGSPSWREVLRAEAERWREMVLSGDPGTVYRWGG